ncbi:unnamed protein product [Absidia cylindrospora]
MNKGKERQLPTTSSEESPLMSTSNQDLLDVSQTDDNDEGFDMEQVYERFQAKFGPTGSRWLSVIGSLMGISRHKIKNVKILCDGEIEGDFTIGMRSNENNRYLYYISHIAAALPHSAFLFLEALEEDDETVECVIGYHIPTSLPRSLRYFHAADLPLGYKTRKAHILWSMHFATNIKSKFDSRIYQRCAQNANHYIGMDHMLGLLNRIESNIVLTDEEQAIKWPLADH